MRWLRLTLWVQILVLSLFLNASSAQSSVEPIKAKQRSLTYQIQPNGSRILKWEQTGAFYRSSSGATMNTMGDRSTLFDEQGNTWNIIHSKKIANFVEHPAESSYEIIKKTPPESILGYEMVNGLQCAVGRVLFNGKLAGKSYSYLPYGLEVKFEVKVPGTSQLEVREMYDMEVAEPDPALLRIPEGYAIHNQLRQ